MAVSAIRRGNGANLQSQDERRSDESVCKAQGVEDVKRYLMWSGGKDSSASICICYEKGIPLDGVVMAEVMFDHARGISGENPKHIEWVYGTAIPIIEKMGYKVIIVKADSDYMQEFHHIVEGSKNHERNGKKSGFFIGGMCAGNGRLKMRPLRKFLKAQGEIEEIVGIAKDEPIRLARLKKGKRSVLAENGITEEMTYPICRKYGLLSPTYSGNIQRGGCWFCPNQSVREFAKLKVEYPHLWEELRLMANVPDTISKGFKYGESFFEIERQVDLINSQISIFDLDFSKGA